MSADIGFVRGPARLPRIWQIEFYEDESDRKPVRDWIKHDVTPTRA